MGRAEIGSYGDAIMGSDGGTHNTEEMEEMEGGRYRDGKRWHPENLRGPRYEVMKGLGWEGQQTHKGQKPEVIEVRNGR